MLCELVPQAAVIALLVDPENEMAEKHIRTTQEAARAKGIKLAVLKASTEAEIDAAFAAIQQLQAGGLLVAADAFFFSRRAQFVALAAQHAVPAIYWNPVFVAAGGLVSYGTDTDALFREAGIYAGRILKGAKPADLPVPQPTTFRLVVNLKTAKALGLTASIKERTRARDRAYSSDGFQSGCSAWYSSDPGAGSGFGRPASAASSRALITASALRRVVS